MNQIGVIIVVVVVAVIIISVCMYGAVKFVLWFQGE